jgi:DNA-binding GntR family transcriptional regulator
MAKTSYGFGNPLLGPAHKQRPDAEHQQILEAVRSGNAARVAQILQSHLLQTGELLATYLTQHLADAS